MQHACDKQLAVIILNWNGIDLLKRFLPSVVSHTMGEEVDLWVADNGSTDESVEWISCTYPDIKLLRFDKNYGFAEGYNRALEATRYPFTILLNSDIETTPCWWQPLLKYMQTHADVGAIQPKIKSYKDKEYFEYAGAAGGYLDVLGYPYCRGRLFDHIEKDEGQYDGEPVEVCWASGAAMMVRTDLYLQLGGLDPLFFAHMEEIDLCCRMWGAGYRVMALTECEVYHLGGGSLQQGSPRKTYLNFRNNLLLLHKNLPKKRGKKILFARRLADTLAYLKFLFTFDFKNAGAILKAHADFKHMRKNYTDFPGQDYMSQLPGSKRKIVMERYIFGKKK